MPGQPPADGAQLDDLEQSLRSQVESQEFEAASVALHCYRAALDHALSHAVPAERLTLLQRSSELCRYARTVALIHRSRYQARLLAIRRTEVYTHAYSAAPSGSYLNKKF